MTIHDTAQYNGHHPPEQPPAPRRPTRAERRVAAEYARADREAIRDQARRDRERRREQLRTERAERRADAAEAWRDRLAAWWHRFVLVAAIVGVNAVAVVGQVTAFTAAKPAGFGWPMPLALAIAAVVESIAIYVGWHAHTALVEGDSVMRLRLTSYAIAAGVGALNYHHYAPDWSPSDMAIMFGCASLLSPWLWAMHSRHQHRAQLRERGLIDPRAPKFSALRWLLWRAETWQALRWAVRHGEQSPAAAIIGVHVEQAASEAADLSAGAGADVVAAQAALIRAQSAALEAARLCPADDVPKDVRSASVSTRVVLDAVSTRTLPPSPEVTDPETSGRPTEEHPKDVRSADRETFGDPDEDLADVLDDDSDDARERRDEQDNRAAEKWIRDRARTGTLPKIQDVADKYGRSRTWARTRVQTVRDRMTARGYVVRPGNVVVPPAGGVDIEDAEETAGGAS